MDSELEIFWVTVLNRTRPGTSPDEAFTELDQYLLDELVPDKPARNQTAPLAHYITKLARLGGYFARAHDLPPGNIVIWRGRGIARGKTDEPKHDDQAREHGVCLINPA